MAKGQKEAVVEAIQNTLPSLTLGKDITITLLSHDQLELIKANIFAGILNGDIEYSKDVNNVAEVRTYARSMVMNHLKKAKELNGGMTYTPSHTLVKSDKTETNTIKGLDMSILPDELKEYVKTLY